MRLLSVLIVCMTGLICTGCTALPNAPTLSQYPENLISGELAFGYEIEAAQALDLLTLSPEMNRFLDESRSRDSNISYVRFQRVMNGLTDRGYFRNSYTRDGTYSAAETFARARGNCLGYTNMFITLARAVGLPARYQLVESDPKWDVSNGLLVRNNHINLELGEMKTVQGVRSKVIVDFNQTQPEGEVRSRIISDEHAASLFSANIGVKQMVAGDMEAAFAHLRRAVETYPANRVAWNNLGVLYSRMQNFEASAAAFEMALEIEPNDKSAWTGLSVVLKSIGRADEAEMYASKIKRYQNGNPYFHYAIATDAYRSQSYEEAMRAIKSAISLKKSDARFFTLQANVARVLGDDVLADKSSRLAKRKYRSQANSVTASYYSDGS